MPCSMRAVRSGNLRGFHSENSVALRSELLQSTVRSLQAVQRIYLHCRDWRKRERRLTKVSFGVCCSMNSPLGEWSAFRG